LRINGVHGIIMAYCFKKNILTINLHKPVALQMRPYDMTKGCISNQYKPVGTGSHAVFCLILSSTSWRCQKSAGKRNSSLWIFYGKNRFAHCPLEAPLKCLYKINAQSQTLIKVDYSIQTRTCHSSRHIAR
jgi:hypothetical protein